MTEDRGDATSDGSAGSAGSAGSSAPRRVEFLAKVRYTNDLPPPPLAPKPVRYALPVDGLLAAGSLSAVFAQRALKPETDLELGMPLDLSGVDAAFDAELGADVLCPPPAEALDPDDEALMGEPEPSGTALVARHGASSVGSLSSRAQSASFGSSVPSSGKAATAAQFSGRDAADRPSSEIGMGTSFLRRTAYMTGETRRSAQRKTAGGSAGSAGSDDARIDREIRRIEQTFVDAQVPLGELRHPSKKGVTAVAARPLLPNAAESDLSFFEVRLLGSAALDTLAAPPGAEALKASVFHHNRLGSGASATGYEWMSFFAPESEEEAAKLNALRGDPCETLGAAEAQAEEQAVFPLAKLQDDDFSVLPAQHRFDEVVISEAPNAFFCVPVSGRFSLRRRRVAPALQAQTKAAEFDVLDLGLRELTPQESIQRDEVRSIYDPVNYG